LAGLPCDAVAPAYASQMVYLHCITTCAQYVVGGPNGQEYVQDYTVPSNRYLVITAADVTSSNGALAPCATPAWINIGTKIGDYTLGRSAWALPANTLTTHFTYPPGFAFAPGTSIQILFANNCAIEVNLYGYLTTN
jgi:hypothetical protein